MSTTYTIVCDQCKVKYWYGQEGMLYSPEMLETFLAAHESHPMRSLNDNRSDEDHYPHDYRDVEDELGERTDG